jgi:catechol 2,3-dioxygenase-like lactoylglutathione lyase family enzyme
VSRPVCIDHLTLPVRDLEVSRVFYAAALGALGWVEATVAGMPTWGPPGAEDFSIAAGEPPPGGMHLAFLAENRGRVGAFHAAGLAAGGTDNGTPAPRPQYDEGYFAAFLLDPDGNNVEAVLHEQPHEPEPPLVSPA